jgi:predicted house-cleaning noncanonical NTP pyrophosphatase (MazG superfamily)
MELSNNNREIQLSRHAQEEGASLINTPEAQKMIAEYATKMYPSFGGGNTDPEYKKAIKKYFDEHCAEILKEKFVDRDADWFFDTMLMAARITQIPQEYQGQFVEYCIRFMEYNRHVPTNLLALAKAIDQHQIQISPQSKKELAHYILVQVNSAEKLNEPQVLSIIGNPAEVVTEAQQEMKKILSEANYLFFLKLLFVYQKYVNNAFDLINNLWKFYAGTDIIITFGRTSAISRMFQNIIDADDDDRYADLWVKILQEKGVRVLLSLFFAPGESKFDPNKTVFKALVKHFSQTPITTDDISTINLEATAYAYRYLLSLFNEIKENGGDYSQIIKYLLTTDDKNILSMRYAGFLFELPDEEILPILPDVLKKWEDYIAIDIGVIEVMPRILELLEKPGQEESLEYFASHIVPQMDLSKFPRETANKIWQLLKKTGWAEYYTDGQSVETMARTEDAESNINEMLETSRYLSIRGLTKILLLLYEDDVKVNVPLLKQKILETLAKKGVYFKNVVSLLIQLKNTETQIHEFGDDYHKQVLKIIDDNLLNYVSSYDPDFFSIVINEFVTNQMTSLDFFYKIIEVAVKGSIDIDAIFSTINSYYKELDGVDFYRLYKIAQKYNIGDKFVLTLHGLIRRDINLSTAVYSELLTQDQLQKIIDDDGYKAFSENFFMNNYFKEATDAKLESNFTLPVGKFTMTFDTQKVLSIYYSHIGNANYFLTRTKKFKDEDVKKNMIEAASAAILTNPEQIFKYKPSIEEEPLVLNGAINYLPLSDDRKSWQHKNNLYNSVAKILKSNNMAAPENNLNKESTKNQLFQKELEETKEFIVGNKQQDAMGVLADLMGGKNTGGEKKIKILYNAQLNRGTSLHDIVVNLQNDQFQKATRDKQFGSLVLSYVIRRADYSNFPDLIVAASKLPIFYSQKRQQIDADIRKQMADGTIVIHDYKELKRKIDEELKKVETPTIPELLKIQEGVEFVPSNNNLSKFKNMMYKYSEGKDADRIDDYVDRLSRQEGFADLEAAIIKPLQKVYEVNGNKYRIEILRKDDPLGMVLGERLLTGCCQKFGGAGQAAMERGYLRPDHAFSVLYREIDDIPVSQGILYYHIQESPVVVPVTNRMKIYKSLLNLDPDKEYYFENETAGKNKLFGWYSIKNEGGTISLSKAEDRYLLFDSIEFHDMFVKSTAIVGNNQLLNAWLKLYQDHYNVPDMKIMGTTSMDAMKKQKAEIEQAWKAFAKDLKEIYKTKMVSMGTGYTDFDIKGLPVTQENKYDGDGYSDADYSTDAKKTVRLAQIGSSHISEDLKNQIISETSAIVSQNPNLQYGLRMLPSSTTNKIGDVLPSSYHWDDGECTGEEIGATSATGIRNNKTVASDMATFMKSNYFGKQIALIEGLKAGSGDDIGEHLFEDAQIVKIWNVMPNRNIKLSSSGNEIKLSIKGRG